MSKNQSIPELSVVILCYHSADVVRDLVAQVEREMEEARIDYELVLVGNYLPGDTKDRTPEVLKELAESKPRFTVVAREKQGMMGWDMRLGLEAAKGRHIAVIDGDGQMPMSDVIKVYRVLQVGRYDLVKTFRAQRQDGVYRRTISGFYNFLFRLLYPAAHVFRDINSKPKVMTREAYDKIHLVSNDWFTDAEIMIEALRHDLSVGEVSTVFYRNERRGTFVPISAIFEFLGNLIYYRFFKKSGST
ncbi:MAG: glycosyltransferase family 2 protein [Kiritimatiellae bacterium]|nr:glycosyltransferase family 2 protein [Kiritimatiellia bacterium]MDD4342472.1 glycosyltransferase family 2 protein [Kiritimatiellia bacterium]